MSSEDGENIYQKKLETTRHNMIKNGKERFTASQMQRLHKISFNHAMQVIDHGLTAGTITKIGTTGRYWFT